MGSFDEFITYPTPVPDDPKPSTNKADYITNGEIISCAIREKDNVLKMEMERRFVRWCDETHHSIYSAGDKKEWKSLRFEE